MKPVMNSQVGRSFGRVSRFAAACAMLATFASCATKQQQVGDASSYLIIASLEAASGASPDEPTGVLASDVQTFVTVTVGDDEMRVPTIFADNGLVNFVLAMKDPGAQGSATTPSPTNFITVTRYRVNYVRADGRNTPGVDVPYPFDGAITLTVGPTQVEGSFNIVRIQAKEEAPLLALVGSGGARVISTIAQVTFYGRDQAGREVSVTGQIGVNFADWGDPS